MKKLDINNKTSVMFFSNIIFVFAFFNFGVGFLNLLGLLVSCLVIFFSTRLVKNYKNEYDFKLLKILFPYLICFFSVVIAFSHIIDNSVLAITVSSCFIVNIILLEKLTDNRIELSTQKSKGLFFAIILVVTTIVFQYFGWNSNNFLNKRHLVYVFYILFLLQFIFDQRYKIHLKELKLQYQKNYFLQKTTALLLILGKVLLVFNCFNSSNIFQVAFVINSIIFILSFREKKQSFILACLSIIIIGILPGKLQFTTIDPGAVSLIAMIFYFKSPILYHKTNRYGELYVYYDYRKKKKILLNNKVLHGVEDDDYHGGECRHQYYTGIKQDNAFYSLLKKYSSKSVDIGVVGMGIGMLASLINKKQKITFFEINPELKNLAVNSGIFNYIKYCKGKVQIDIGHARKLLKHNKNAFDILVIDAYDGGKVVPEFLTEEAFDLYFNYVLRKDGFVLIHLTSSDRNGIGMIDSVVRKKKLNAKLSFQSTDDGAGSNVLDSIFVKDTSYPSILKKFYEFIFEGIDYITTGSLFALSKSKNITWAVVYKSKLVSDLVKSDGRWHRILESIKNVDISDESVGYRENVQITNSVS